MALIGIVQPNFLMQYFLSISYVREFLGNEYSRKRVFSEKMFLGKEFSRKKFVGKKVLGKEILPLWGLEKRVLNI